MQSFEQDAAPWKLNTLMAGAMFDHGGRGWDAGESKYKTLGGPTDGAELMEHAWVDILEPEGFSRVRLYEKASPPGIPEPSPYPVDADLERWEMLDQWREEDYGLVKVAGHGDSRNVFRVVWETEFIQNGIVDNPTEPMGGTSHHELREDLWFLASADQNQLMTPNNKAPVLMAMACDTGQWAVTDNMAATLLRNRRISAWTGGAGTTKYKPSWEKPSDGLNFTLDYYITQQLFSEWLPLGDAVWTGLKQYHTQFNTTWVNGHWDWGFMDWNLYGDPSMNYWGSGPDVHGPWPTFQHDQPGAGETPYRGPDMLITRQWVANIAPAPLEGRVSSPVVGSNGLIVVGDGQGMVWAFKAGTGGSLAWQYQTGGTIQNAAALSVDGTVYVHATNGKLYAISQSGALHWSRTPGVSMASPKIAADGRIYVGGSYNGQGGMQYYLRAYWPSGVLAASQQVDGMITTAPSIASTGEIWVGTAAGTLYRMSADLDQADAYPVCPGFEIGDGLALAEEVNYVFVPSLDGNLYAWSTNMNGIVWTFQTGGAVRSAPAISLDGNKVFFGSGDGKVYGLKLSDGSLQWEHNAGGKVDTSPALDPIDLYIVGGDPLRLQIFRKSDGSSYYSSFLPGSVNGGSPAVGEGNMLYVSTSLGELIAFGVYEMEPPDLYLYPIPMPDPEIVYLGWHTGYPEAWIRVERRIPGGSWSELVTMEPGSSYYEDHAVVAGQYYQYRGQALAESVVTTGLRMTAAETEGSRYSSIVQARPLQAIPATPGAPRVTALSSSSLQLTWTDVPRGTMSMRILRYDLESDTYQPVGDVPGDAAAFTDPYLEPGATYSYRLQAVGEAGNSPTSGIGRGTTWTRSLPAPTGVAVQPVNSSTFRICWTPGVVDAFTVVARRPQGSADAEVLVEDLGGESCYVDESAYLYTFEYRVKHKREGDESAWAMSALTTAVE